MCSVKRRLEEILLISVCSFILVVSTMEGEIGSPLKVAQCRASCILKFANSTRDDRGSCLQGADCNMCWENCQLLQSNFAVWGAICDEKGLCFPGCVEACQFHNNSESQRVPVIHTRGEDVVESGGGVASWPSSTDGPFVYIVMRRAIPGGPWRQIIQTENHSARVPDGGVLKVLAVNAKGLRTIYSPASGLARAKQVLASLGLSLTPLLRPTQPPKRINTEIHPSTPYSFLNEENQVQSRWELHEVSLIHQKVLVIAEISWPGRHLNNPQKRSVYFVTWEVDGGGLKGNLFTDSTSVTLSLWPRTIYHIQVELVDDIDKTTVKSEVLIVDTARAEALEIPEQPQNNELSYSDSADTPELRPSGSDRFELPASSSFTHESSSISSDLPEHQAVDFDQPSRIPVAHVTYQISKSELALGLLSAFFLFSLITVSIVAIRRRPPHHHQKLIEAPNLTRIFPPLVRIVQEHPSTPNRTCSRTLHV